MVALGGERLWVRSVMPHRLRLRRLRWLLLHVGWWLLQLLMFVDVLRQRGRGERRLRVVMVEVLLEQVFGCAPSPFLPPFLLGHPRSQRRGGGGGAVCGRAGGRAGRE